MIYGKLSIDAHVFRVHFATFRFIADDGQGKPGWEFNICTEGIASDSDEELWCGNGVRFYAEGNPIPLPDSADLVGQAIRLEGPYDEESGDPYFSIYIGEHGDVDKLTMKFLGRDGNRYHVEVEARLPAAGSLFKDDRHLKIDTWIERLPTGRYGTQGPRRGQTGQ